MGGPERPAWFVGDLGDPWVVAIAERLPSAFVRRDCPGEMPESWTVEGVPPSLVVLHRPILTGLDVQRVARLRSRGEPQPRTILCVGPYARHEDLARSARHFDIVLSEATAAETIRRHVEPERPRPAHRPTVQVVSGLHDIRNLLVDVCRGLGYRAEAAGDVEGTSARGLVVWEVPMLDPRWPDRMAERARSSSVVALMGFADREAVVQARQAGAAACLEWPCDLDDLSYVLDRIASGPRAEPGHAVPPSPAFHRRNERAEVAGPGRPA
jgi:hypothetical protein